MTRLGRKPVSNGQAPVPLSLPGQICYAAGSAAFTILERMIILYVAFFFLPPEEYAVHNLVPNRTYLGLVTVLGAALLLGRIFDGAADPVVAFFSDNSRSRFGRRKIFLLLSGLPLAVSAVLIFFPPRPAVESLLNGIWLGFILCVFYIAFTAYVNPYLALLSELGHTDTRRINLSTLVAFFGLLGMVGVSIFFPLLVGSLQAGGYDLRGSYRAVAVGCGILSAILLYVAPLGFDERVHCAPAAFSLRPGLWRSLRDTFAMRPFRLFLAGEVFMQFAMNIVTLGLLYYTVVLFKREQSFMTVLAALTVGTALLFFPLVNFAARRVGKKKVILCGVALLSCCSLAIFFLSPYLSGPCFYPGLFLFALGGAPMAILVILINPTIADLAREDAARTGRRREAMFFGARAVPLKLAIAMAGVTFAFLLSRFGKDIAAPLGVRLSLLAVAVSAVFGYIFFSRYPEEKIRSFLRRHEEQR